MNFPTTRWSLIVASDDTAAARAAWSELAAIYRSPIQTYFRCRFGADRAEDLTQAFFADSIAGGWWARADMDRGSFRTYLRMLLRRFGARHGQAAASSAELNFEIDEVAGGGDPEAAYDRDFAHVLVTRALQSLRDEQANNECSDALFPHLLDRGDPGELKRIAADLGLPQNTLLQRLRRMRSRLRELIRYELSQLVADSESIDGELVAIRDALSQSTR